MEDWFGNKTEIVVNNFIIGTEFFKYAEETTYFAK